MGEDEPALTAAETFDLVGHDVRLAIVQELARPRMTNWQWQGMTFAELRRAVGVRDGGNFSYHLDKLLGHFVVMDDDVYKLTNAGMELLGAIRSGSVTDREASFETAVDQTCPVCEARMTAEYERGFLTVACEAHDVIFGTSMPPGATRGRAPQDVVRFATMTARHDVERARAGACPHCWGPMAVTLDPEEVEVAAHDLPGGVGEDFVMAEFECGRCEMRFWIPAGACVVSDPPVVAFYHDTGADVRDISYADLDVARPDFATVVDRDPLRVRVDVDRDGEALTLWLDDDARIVDHERT